MNDTMIGYRAVVLGASVAGLLSARVLSDAYAQVTVVERDKLPETNAPRQGVPQGRHIHGLMARGQQVLEELFPGFTEDLMAQGVPLMDQAGHARLYMSGHRLMPSESGITVLSASRPCLEGYLRARVRTLPGVTFADCRDVVGIATTPDRNRVTGARVIRRADGSTEETLDADLVVDATGRGSRTPLWLDGLGYGRPTEEKFSIGVGYASGTFRLAPGTLGRDLAIINAPTSAHPRGGGLSALEGDRYIVTLMGILGDHPPTDHPGFLGFAKSMQFPDIYDAIRDAEPLDAPVSYRFPASVRHRYERLPRLPDGLVVTGDAVCSFNPIYGQGMSVAALEALALQRHLTRGRQPRTRKVMGDIARAVDLPWDMAAGGDLAFPGVEGNRNAKVRLGNAYLPRLHAAAAHDAKLAVAFLRVAGMLARPATLFQPDIVLRVLRQSLTP
ncbi:MAG TPA: FAD-dependent monooxygenase [Nocardioidaceae bacterium]|nr:FAD-dependent monooxygenase [Nocardioidaceae bacterium]